MQRVPDVAASCAISVPVIIAMVDHSVELYRLLLLQSATAAYAKTAIRRHTHVTRFDSECDSESSWRIEYRYAGELHREDGPAIEWGDGAKAWYRHGRRHRKDGPAVETRALIPVSVRREDDDSIAIKQINVGIKMWYIDNHLHREDGPAVERADGRKEWYWCGRRHRDGDPAVERGDGHLEWYFDGKRHRQNGPADVSPGGTKRWYWRGRYHRRDGPAIEWSNGCREWYRHGVPGRKAGPALAYEEAQAPADRPTDLRPRRRPNGARLRPRRRPNRASKREIDS